MYRGNTSSREAFSGGTLGCLIISTLQIRNNWLQSRLLSEKLIVTRLFKNPMDLVEQQMLLQHSKQLAIFPLSWARWIQSAQSYSIFRPILILFSKFWQAAYFFRASQSKQFIKFFPLSAHIIFILKVKFSLYRPWRPLELREVEAPTFSDIRLIDGGKVVSPTGRPLFTPRKIPGTHVC
jgi:hypothetical protein